MPGFEWNRETETTPAPVAAEPTVVPAPTLNGHGDAPSIVDGVYYNARLDPKNFLEGPISTNPATRLRQMLARPGIVVRDTPSVI